MILKYNNSNIHFTVSGKGKTVVLLHGFTESLEIWNYFAEKLSEQFQVVCIDLPGHGKSDCISDVHTMDDMAEVVKAVLEGHNVETSVMIGHSMGGYVTLAFAEKYPGSLKGFGLFHSSAFPDTEEGRMKRSRAIEIIRKNHHSYLTGFIPDLFTVENRETFSDEVENLIKTAKQMSKEAVIAAQEGMKVRPERLYVLKNATCPVLFIAGHKDSRIPFEKTAEQVSLPTETHVLLLREVAHMGYIEAKIETFHFISCFLNRVFTK